VVHRLPGVRPRDSDQRQMVISQKRLPLELDRR
jgi:hypothetical protein